MTSTQAIHEFAVKNLLVERYLLGELSGMDLEDFEQHMFECSICFDQVKAGREFKRHLAAGVQAPPRKSRRSMQWWQRIKQFFRKPGKPNALLLLFLFAGPGPVPPLPAGYQIEGWVSKEIPFVLAGAVIFALAVSALLRYSESFREFWASHVCAFMEEHGVRTDETKGGA